MLFDHLGRELVRVKQFSLHRGPREYAHVDAVSTSTTADSIASQNIYPEEKDNEDECSPSIRSKRA